MREKGPGIRRFSKSLRTVDTSEMGGVPRDEYGCLLDADNKEPFSNAGVKDEWGLWGKKRRSRGLCQAIERS